MSLKPDRALIFFPPCNNCICDYSKTWLLQLVTTEVDACLLRCEIEVRPGLHHQPEHNKQRRWNVTVLPKAFKIRTFNKPQFGWCTAHTVCQNKSPEAHWESLQAYELDKQSTDAALTSGFAFPPTGWLRSCLAVTSTWISQAHSSHQGDPRVWEPVHCFLLEDTDPDS